MGRFVSALANPKRLTQVSLGLTVLTYLLIVVGGLTRAYGAGLACPDWPKCFGQWIPPMNSLVFLEWFHRLVAATVSTGFLVLVAWVLAVAEFRRRHGALILVAVGLLTLQIILGALTVRGLLRPEWVFLHLGTALAFYGSLLVTTLRLRRVEGPEPQETVPPGVRSLSWVATLATYGQALLGVAVSSHYAGLACPDWPLCNGMLFPPLTGAVGLQVIHRLGAYTVAGLIVALMVLTRPAAPALRRGAQLACGLVFLQIALGVANVFLGVPPALSGLHLATAVALWTTLITMTAATAQTRSAWSRPPGGMVPAR